MEPDSHRPEGNQLRPWQRALGRFFAQAWVEVVIGLLVLGSVALTLLEFALDVSAPGQPTDLLQGISLVNELITLVFVVELSLRYLAAPLKLRFLREYWIDILAVLPLFRIFRSVRIIRLLRLIRLLRMFGVASRLSVHFPDIVRRGAVEYFFVCGLLALTVLFGTGAMMFFEGPARPLAEGAAADESFQFVNAFWFSVYSLFAGEPVPGPPRTLGGNVVAVFVMFMGLTIFAMFTGTVSAFMVERLRTEGHVVNWEHLEDHVIICGWNSKAELILREFRASQSESTTPVVVITQYESEAPRLPSDVQKNVGFLNDDFTRVPALEQAGVHRAKTCIIMADLCGGRTEQDADARTILAALTVEKLNPAVYTCAELLNRSYGTHLQMGRVNDYVVSGEYGAYMLAQAAMNGGLMGVFSELLTYQHGNEFYRTALPAAWVGRSFLDVFVELKRAENAILIGVQPKGGEMLVNPIDYVFQQSDEIVVISENEPAF